MRNIKIGLIVIFSLLAIWLGILMVRGIAGQKIFYLRNNAGQAVSQDMRLVLDEEVALDGIEDIRVLYDMNGNDVYLYEGEGNTLKIKEYLGSGIKDNEASTVSVSSGELEIKGKKRNSIGFSFFFHIGTSNFGNGSYTEIWIPASYQGDLQIATASGDIISEPDIMLAECFEAESTSGTISIPAVDAKEVSIYSTSGDIKIDTINTKSDNKDARIDIATTSGDMYLKRLSGAVSIETTSGYVTAESILGDAELASTSGDINVKHIDGNVDATSTSGFVKISEGSGERNVSTTSGEIVLEGTDGAFDIDTASGEISVKAQKGAGSIETISGDVRLELSELTGNLDLNTTSGEVGIKISDNNSFEFEANSTSGDINTFFDDSLKFSKGGNSATGTYGNNTQEHKIDIETTSGDVRITKNYYLGS